MSASASKAWAMLNARALQFEGARGGVPELTSSDIARMLQGLAPGPFFAGMLRESQDLRCLRKLELLVTEEALCLRHPHDPALIYARAMAGLAVYEFLFPRALKCSTCNGRGWVKQDGQGVECYSCQNAGGTKLTPEMRAELVGVPVREWDRLSGFYEQVHSVVQGWHSQAMAHLALRMHKEPDERSEPADGETIVIDEVAKITGYSTSWIREMVKRGDFPQPDIKGTFTRGWPNMWLASKVRLWSIDNGKNQN